MRQILKLTFIFVTSLAFELLADVMPTDTLTATYKLHGQTRRIRFFYEPTEQGSLTLHWSIVRNLKLWTGSYAMSPSAVKDGDAQSWLMPEDGKHVNLPSDETFAIISLSALTKLKEKGEFTYNNILWKKTGEVATPLGIAIEVEDPAEGAHMQILDNPDLPLILSMQSNPLEINWTITQ